MSVRSLLLSLIVLVLAGCGETPPVSAFDIELVQDFNINTTEQVLERVDEILVIADSAEGLYLPGAESPVGDVQVIDFDSDPDDLELVVTVAVPTGRLPLIRLERGGLPDVPLDLRLVGVSADAVEFTPEVEGSVRGIRFEQGIVPMTIPFNIRPELLPPRVTEVLPGDGVEVQECDVQVVTVIFSKPIDEASLLGPGVVTVDPGGAPPEIRLDTTGMMAHVILPEPFHGLSTFEYSLTITSDVIDLYGQPLDQIPTEEGAQTFDHELTMVCVPRTTVQIVPCGTITSPPCPPLDRIECIDGICTPVGCQGSQCPDGLVCNSDLSLCEVDCRLYGDDGACPAERPSCDPETGFCL